jgi:putative addiction module component (TIGR02574 family)
MLFNKSYVRNMALTNIAVAEEALCLSPPERAELAKLLIQSLEGDNRTNAEIQADLRKRFEALRSGSDPGLTFNEVFGEPG